MDRKSCTGQCIGQWFHSTGAWVEKVVLDSALVSQDGSIPLWCVGRKSCTGQCVGQWFHSAVVSGKKELYWAVRWSVVPFCCGEWEERVVLGSALVSGSIPL